MVKIFLTWLGFDSVVVCWLAAQASSVVQGAGTYFNLTVLMGAIVDIIQFVNVVFELKLYSCSYEFQ